MIETEGVSRDDLHSRLLEGRRLLRERIYDNPCHSVDGVLDLIGHSHLDLVFLWDYAEFVRKAGRTHATMLRLLEQYPDFIFSQSQPVMYEELRINYPDLFRQIQQRVIEGRWEPLGAMWCEPDCNLISGESFVRQIQTGVTYFEKYFGVTPKTCWLPDVFGNAFTMPQILKKSGIEFFVTHKMNIWNDTNPWKDNAFWWEGPDGSRIFATVPPTHFIGTMEPDSLRAHWNRFSEKETIGESLYCYGWGDGGGGVDTEMLEYAKRLSKFPGLPRTRAIKVEDALQSMCDRAHSLTVWKDELYLEAHRGVGTTKALLKKYNRKSENLYRAAEMMSVFAGLFGARYPAEELDEGWRRILTAQFHDSLPGTHITPVFVDLCREYDRVFQIGERALDEALAVLNRTIAGEEKVQGGTFTLWNFLGVSARNIAHYPAADVAIHDGDGNRIPSQTVTHSDGTVSTVFLAQDVPSAGCRAYVALPSDEAVQTLPTTQDVTIETDFFIARFDQNGQIESLFDKRYSREITRGGVMNRFRLFEDRPGKYEAWDIIATYVDHEISLSPGRIEQIEEGDVCTVVTIRKEILSSVLMQNIYFYKHFDRVDFETKIKWRERRKLLKVEFPVDISARSFISDIAYGTIERSNCRHTPYDKAKFEVSAHNFIDLSEGDYGVSLLNDCKYGHEVDGNRMMLTLLKGPMNPDPVSDIGVHTFTYALYPHAGDYRHADTVTQGLRLNNPLHAQPILGTLALGQLPLSLVQLSTPNVTLEALKKAQDGDGIIVRICERTGQITKVELRFCVQLQKAYACNLIERNDSVYPVKGNILITELKPFEVQAFRLWL